jgi:Xaa-Pro aminopeptidase
VVITVEPGLYISEDNDDVPTEYRGIGIRIEDDVLVTETGYENLSEGLPKTTQDVERACAA